MKYACSAVTDSGARCRNFVERNGEMCPIHQGAKQAPRPGKILVKFNLNQNRSQEFAALGVPRKNLLAPEKEAAHVQGAEAIGRNPYRFRQIADSGVPVFGAEGVSDVSLFETLKELFGEERYCITDIHLRPRRDGKMDVLVVTLGHGKEVSISAMATQELLRFLVASCWGYCHVWANPPGEGGTIVHTVNSSHRQPDKPASRTLQFNGGLWAVVETSPIPAQ